MLVNFVYVGLGPLVEEGVIHVVRVVLPLFFHLAPAGIGAVVAGSRDYVHSRTVRLYHVDLFRRRTLRHKDLTVYPASSAVCRHAVSGVAAAVLDNRIHTYRFAVSYKDRCAPVLEGEGRHEIIHFEEHIIAEAYYRGHSLSESNLTPCFVLQGHELFVAEHSPDAFVYARRIIAGRIKIKLPEPSAVALRLSGRRAFFNAAFGTDKIHLGTSATASISTRHPKWSFPQGTTHLAGL